MVGVPTGKEWKEANLGLFQRAHEIRDAVDKTIACNNNNYSIHQGQNHRKYSLADSRPAAIAIMRANVMSSRLSFFFSVPITAARTCLA
jgi:hypothetical protein